MTDTKEIVTAGAAASAAAAKVTPAAVADVTQKMEQLKITPKDTSTEKKPASQLDITYVEALIEANVQRSLDSLDAWKLTAPFRGERPDEKPKEGRCSREKHTCNLESEDVGASCVGCVLYRRIVKERAIFPVGGRADVCEYLASGIAEPLIFAFIRNGDWLNPTAQLTGHWFVKHPITYIARPTSTMIPTTQVAIRRNKIRLFEGDALLEKLGLSAFKDTIYSRLHDYWHTESEGVIYSLDELLDILNPWTQVAMGAHRLGIALDELADTGKVIAGIQNVVRELTK